MNVPFHRFRCRIGHYTCQIWSCPSYQSRTVHPGGNEIVRIVCAILPRPTLTHFLRNGACAGEPVTKVPPFRKNPAIFWSVFVLFNEIIRFCPYFSNERNYPCSNAQNYPCLSFLFKLNHFSKKHRYYSVNWNLQKCSLLFTLLQVDHFKKFTSFRYVKIWFKWTIFPKSIDIIV